MRTSSAMRALACVGLATAACSLMAPSDDEYVGGSPDTDAGSPGGSAGEAGSGGSSQGGTSGGAGGDAGKGGSGGVGGNGGNGGNGGVGGGGGDAGNGGSAGATCSPSTHPLDPQPVALYLMLDRTYDMQAGDSADARQGIMQWLNVADSSTRVALQYFPPVSGVGSCSGSPYDQPLIAMAPVTSNDSAIGMSLQTVGTAPTFQDSQLQGVLDGGLDYSTSWAKQNPNHQARLVIITNWEASADECSVSTVNLVGLAQAAAAADPPVLTHILAFEDADVQILNAIAAAGGTGVVTTVQSENTVRTALSRAEIPCSFDFPALGSYGQLTVTLSSFPGSNTLQQVSGPQACAGDGFFVTGSPATAIVLCPSTCATLSAIGSTPNATLQASCP